MAIYMRRDIPYVEYTKSSNDRIFTPIYEYDKKISSIEFETKVKINNTGQYYIDFNMLPNEDYTKTRIVISLGPWNGWHVETKLNGNSLVTRQSGGSLSYGVEYTVKVTLGRNGGTFNFNGTTTTLTYDTDEKNVIQSIFDSNVASLWCGAYNDSNIVKYPVYYKITYMDS